MTTPLIPFLAVLTAQLTAQTTLFEADFNTDANGNNAAITDASASATTGSWTGPEGGQSGTNDIGEIIGNAVGAASTDNALMIDSGEDDDGTSGIIPTNTDALLQGNFASPAAIGTGDPFTFSFDLYHTRITGNTTNNLRNFRLSLNSGDTRRMILALELHGGSSTDLVVRDGNADYDTPSSSIIVDDFSRPTTNRADGDYNPSFAISVTINVDAAGAVTISSTSPNGTAQTVTSTTLPNLWNGASSTPAFLDNFELHVGGSNTGSKGAILDNFLATGTAYTGSTAGDLVTSIAPAFPAPTLAEHRNPGSNLGNSTVAAGNTKGQSFSLPAPATLDSFVFEVGTINTAGDFTLEVFRAMDGVPWLPEPVFSDGGALPAGLQSGDFLQIDLPAPLNVQRGSYTIALTGLGATSFALPISNGALYAAGAGARNNSADGWRRLVNADADFFFAVLGTLDTDPFPTAPAGAPNLIFILADDYGWTDPQTGPTGPNVLHGTNYGSEYYQTPNLARLASEGLSFTHCFVHPNCAPTRAAILSGQYAPRSGNGVYVVNNLNRAGNGNGPETYSPPAFTAPSQREDIPSGHTITAEALQAGGYVTAHFGKYHVGNHNEGLATMPENQGYDCNFGGQHSGAPGNYHATGSQVFGSSIGPGLDHWAKDYDGTYTTGILAPIANGNTPSTLNGGVKHVEDAIGDAAVAFMNDHRNGALSSRPFYLQLHNYAVHTPISNSQARADLLTKYQGLATAGGHDDAAYAAIAESIDQTLGRILNYLEDPDGDGNQSDSIAANTLVIFTSDNGGHIGPTDNDPIRHRKGSFYNGGIRVPLIAWQPGAIPAGQQTDTLVHAVDFFPTLAEHAGLTMPAGVTYDGTSFAAHADDPSAHPRAREPIFYHFPGYLDQRARPCSVVIQRINGIDYKLIHTDDLAYTGNPSSNEDQQEGLDPLTGPWELYAYSEDIGETTNLLDGTYSGWLLYGGIATTMANNLHAWLTQDDADWNAKQAVHKTTSLPAPYATAATLPAVTVPADDGLRIVSIVVDTSADEVTLTWPGEAGFLYDIEATNDLESWAPIATDIPGAGNPTTHTATDPLISTNTERFYRVVLHD